MKNKGLLFALGIVCFSVLFASASPAFAATKAKTYLPSSVSVDAYWYTGTATLTYLNGGLKVGLARQYVSIYRYDSKHRTWVYRAKAKTSSTGAFNVKLPQGYKYRLSYAGSSTRASCSSTLKVLYRYATNLWVEETEYQIDESTGKATVGGQLFTAYGEGSKTVVGAVVRFTREGTSTAFTTTTGADGWWTIDLPVGLYSAVCIGSSRYFPSDVVGFGVGYTFAGTRVEVDPVYRIPASGTTTTVTGIAQSDFGSEDTWGPLDGAVVTVTQYDESTQRDVEVATAVTAADGSWTLDLPRGTYTAMVRNDPDFLAGDGLRYYLINGWATYEFTVAGYDELIP